MKWGRDSVTSAIEKDVQRPQLMLPFPDEKTIDMQRCRSILHVNPWVIRRLCATRLIPGGEETCLAAYNINKWSPLRIEYDSLVRFLDHLRVMNAIPDRRPPMVYGRHRDEHLLPFPWSDTMTVEEVADVLNIHRSKVLLRIEPGRMRPGRIEAYQIVRNSPWRISRSSLAKRIDNFRSASTGAPPYGASKILQGEG